MLSDLHSRKSQDCITALWKMTERVGVLTCHGMVAALWMTAYLLLEDSILPRNFESLMKYTPVIQ